jgi:hypothetical protein
MPVGSDGVAPTRPGNNEPSATRDDEVVAAMVRWSEDFIEQPNRVVSNLPVCPFAKAARLRRTVRFEVQAFRTDDPLEAGGDVFRLVEAFIQCPDLETLFVIHPERGAMSARALERFVARLNARLAAGPATAHLQAFEAHPESEFCIGGIYTRRSPYPSFQILSWYLLKTASDSLLGSGYYDHFTPAMLRAVGMPRVQRAEGTSPTCPRTHESHA